MRRHFIPSDGYRDRAAYRAAFQSFLMTLDVDLFATLSFSQNTSFGQTRQMLGQWFARLDNHYLGRSWARRLSDERTFAVAVPESIGTNPHYHCLMRLPAWGRMQSPTDSAVELDKYWRRLAWGGSCVLKPIDDLAGVARYVTKQLVRPGYDQNYLFASEFHRRPGPDTTSQSSALSRTRGGAA